jgi:hypothetical protein
MKKRTLMNKTIKFSLILLLFTSALFGDETSALSTDSASSAPQEENYKDIIQGSVSAIYTVPVSNNLSGLIDESYGDAAAKVNIDLLLFQKYYGGLYLGYQQSLSEGEKVFYVEKRLGRFGLLYKNIRSQYDATPDTSGTITFTDFNDVLTVGVNGQAARINYSYDKGELKYYCEENIKDRGWFSLFYEKIQTGIAGKETPIGSGNKNYYTQGEIDNYAFSFGAEQLDYMMNDGFDFNKIGASVGMAKVRYTNSLEYEDGDIQQSFGVNLEFAYKKSFNEYSSVIFAVHGDFVKISDILEYGTLGARCAVTF